MFALRIAKQSMFLCIRGYSVIIFRILVVRMLSTESHPDPLLQI